MNLEVSYVPTTRERRRALMFHWVNWLLYAGVLGIVLAVVGIGALSRAAADHGEPAGPAAAAVGGTLLAALPLLVSLWAGRAQIQDVEERHVRITPSGIRVRTGGLAVEMAWDGISSLRETPSQWLIAAGNHYVALPKHAVPPNQAGELGQFLRTMSRPK
jgi:hypothetical protein